MAIHTKEEKDIRDAPNDNQSDSRLRTTTRNSASVSSTIVSAPTLKALIFLAIAILFDLPA
jgi:hypothetical protein